MGLRPVGGEIGINSTEDVELGFYSTSMLLLKRFLSMAPWMNTTEGLIRPYRPAGSNRRAFTGGGVATKGPSRDFGPFPHAGHSETPGGGFL
jgi:hypothetical protein